MVREPSGLLYPLWGSIECRISILVAAPAWVVVRDQVTPLRRCIRTKLANRMVEVHAVRVGHREKHVPLALDVLNVDIDRLELRRLAVDAVNWLL